MISVKEKSELYEHIISTKFDIQDMEDSLKLVLSVKEHLDTLDLFFFVKGIVYSTIRNHPVEGVIKIMYQLDKLNLLINYAPRFLMYF